MAREALLASYAVAIACDGTASEQPSQRNWGRERQTERPKRAAARRAGGDRCGVFSISTLLSVLLQLELRLTLLGF